MELLADHGWLWWIIIGGLAGLIAKVIMPGRDPGGCIVTILLGIGGALVAGFLGRMVGWYGEGDQGASFIAAIVGAIIILFIYRLIVARRA
ncbi:MAG: GlsB/YeaQ/YmgE family stress response membrane protein [Pseudomonadota bacterium]|nr:GlsB/YeaQ/YmgE family stress response membrane protein [Pseudomonadota bacterium]